MDIKIITIHAMHNPGSVFQPYALQEYLKKNSVQIIDYRPDYFYSEGSKFKLLIKKIFYGKIYESRSKKFEKFVQNKMNLTKKYKTYEELEEAQLKADCFIVGSDQLWNADFPCGNDLAFYLKFAKMGKKVSYATSVGKKRLDNYNIEIPKKNLLDFDSLSVRENTTAQLLSNILKRTVKWVCDPVFLLPKEKYMYFIDKKRPFAEKYVVIYLAPKSSVLDCLVAHYKSKGYKIILMGGVTKRCKCDKHIADMGPEDFITYIYYAELVISSSFHATAFCHIFHKNFITIIPESNGERIISLLELTGLVNRGIIKLFSFSEIEKPIEWKIVEERLMQYVEQSKKYLFETLESD